MPPSIRSEILAWYRHPSRLQLARTTAHALANARHLDEAALLGALEDAVWKDTQRLRSDSPAALFDELAVLAVVVRSASEPNLADLSQRLLTGDPLVQALEALTVEGCSELVERIVRSVADEDVVDGVEQVCLSHAADLAHWGWDDDLSAHVPLYISLIMDALDRQNHPFLLMALAALAAFAETNAVPSATQKAVLMQAVRTPSSTADEAALASFLFTLADGSCFMRLATEAARTRHDALLSEFAKIAPPRAGEVLREHLERRVLGAHGIVGLA